MGAQNDRVRVAIFGSGRGSTARALLDYARRRCSSYCAVVIVCDRPGAGIVNVGQEHGVAVHCIYPRCYPSSSAYTSALLDLLQQYRVEVILLAGYLRLIPSEIVSAFTGRILNIHPALLPKFGGKGMYGLHVHRAVLAAGERCSGATVHIVTDEYDAGPIVEQIRVPILSGDTPETLMARVQDAERSFYPFVVERFCQRVRQGKEKSFWL